MSESPDTPPLLLRFAPPVAIAVVALVLPLVVRGARFFNDAHGARLPRLEMRRMPTLRLAAFEPSVTASEPIQHVEDLPLSELGPGRKLSESELTPELIRKAEALLWSQYPPLGAEIPLEVRGRTYIARVEMHFHAEGGPKKPWGYHRGLTLYSAE